MRILEKKQFEKQLLKLSAKIQEKVFERIKLFSVEPNSEVLKNHRLKGGYDGCWSINITGDYRLIYQWVDFETVELLAVGTHSQLYK